MEANSQSFSPTKRRLDSPPEQNRKKNRAATTKLHEDLQRPGNFLQNLSRVLATAFSNGYQLRRDGQSYRVDGFDPKFIRDFSDFAAGSSLTGQAKLLFGIYAEMLDLYGCAREKEPIENDVRSPLREIMYACFAGGGVILSDNSKNNRTLGRNDDIEQWKSVVEVNRMCGTPGVKHLNFHENKPWKISANTSGKKYTAAYFAQNWIDTKREMRRTNYFDERQLETLNSNLTLLAQFELATLGSFFQYCFRVRGKHPVLSVLCRLLLADTFIEGAPESVRIFLRKTPYLQDQLLGNRDRAAALFESRGDNLMNEEFDAYRRNGDILRDVQGDEYAELHEPASYGSVEPEIEEALSWIDQQFRAATKDKSLSDNFEKLLIDFLYFTRENAVTHRPRARAETLLELLRDSFNVGEEHSLACQFDEESGHLLVYNHTETNLILCLYRFLFETPKPPKTVIGKGKSRIKKLLRATRYSLKDVDNAILRCLEESVDDGGAADFVHPRHIKDSVFVPPLEDDEFLAPPTPWNEPRAAAEATDPRPEDPRFGALEFENEPRELETVNHAEENVRLREAAVSMKEETANLERELEQTRQRLNASEQNNRRLDNVLSTTAREKDNGQNLLSNYAEQLETHRRRAGDLERKVEEGNAANAELERKLREKDTRLSHWEDQFRKASQEREEMREVGEKLRNELRVKTATLDSVQREAPARAASQLEFARMAALNEALTEQTSRQTEEARRLRENIVELTTASLRNQRVHRESEGGLELRGENDRLKQAQQLRENELQIAHHAIADLKGTLEEERKAFEARLGELRIEEGQRLSCSEERTRSLKRQLEENEEENRNILAQLSETEGALRCARDEIDRYGKEKELHRIEREEMEEKIRRMEEEHRAFYESMSQERGLQRTHDATVLQDLTTQNELLSAENQRQRESAEMQLADVRRVAEERREAMDAELSGLKQEGYMQTGRLHLLQSELAEAKQHAEERQKAHRAEVAALRVASDRQAAAAEKQLAEAKRNAEERRRVHETELAALRAATDRQATAVKERSVGLEKQLAEARRNAEERQKAQETELAALRTAKDRQATAAEKQLAEAKRNAEERRRAQETELAALRAAEDRQAGAAKERLAALEKQLAEAKRNAEERQKAQETELAALRAATDRQAGAAQERSVGLEKQLAEAKRTAEACQEVREKELAAVRSANDRKLTEAQRRLAAVERELDEARQKIGRAELDALRGAGQLAALKQASENQAARMRSLENQVAKQFGEPRQRTPVLQNQTGAFEAQKAREAKLNAQKQTKELAVTVEEQTTGRRLLENQSEEANRAEGERQRTDDRGQLWRTVGVQVDVSDGKNVTGCVAAASKKAKGYGKRRFLPVDHQENVNSGDNEDSDLSDSEALSDSGKLSFANLRLDDLEVKRSAVDEVDWGESVDYVSVLLRSYCVNFQDSNVFLLQDSAKLERICGSNPFNALLHHTRGALALYKSDPNLYLSIRQEAGKCVRLTPSTIYPLVVRQHYVGNVSNTRDVFFLIYFISCIATVRYVDSALAHVPLCFLDARQDIPPDSIRFVVVQRTLETLGHVREAALKVLSWKERSVSRVLRV